MDDKKTLGFIGNAVAAIDPRLVFDLVIPAEELVERLDGLELQGNDLAASIDNGVKLLQMSDTELEEDINTALLRVQP